MAGDPATIAADRGQAPEERDEDEEDADDEAEGAAADLATFSLGVVLPNRAEQLRQWCRALERTAYEGLSKAARVQRIDAEALQLPRYLMLQALHHAIVRRQLTVRSEPRREASLWETRRAALNAVSTSVTHAPPPREVLSREAWTVLQKHAAAGLTRSYQRSIFSASKMNLRKVRKVLVGALASPDAPLPREAPALPPGLQAQLFELVLQPPTAGQVAEGGGDAGGGEAVEVFHAAADSLVALALLGGSLLTLL
eukprot:5530656-Prymnesium_polylepis.1